MPTQPQSTKVSKTSRTVRDDIRQSNPRPPTIDDAWIQGALVVHSASTR
jgi:hypothetical protein